MSRQLMKTKSSFIYLRGLRFHAFHGVSPQETVVGNDYLIDLRLGFDISKAMVSDDVEDTLNYALVYGQVEKVMKTPSKLLENVAYRIGKSLISDYPGITSIDIELTKVNPPIGSDGKGAGVELHLINDKTQQL